ncbi:Plectin [Frankliniella fusca]|uniref:Plectin n=1 Tax=Frankliniella fusca TaxID=407009 RepID=A0AAE1HYX4_9NEOP|nr:Plectin [Frankliniella fusca]
MLTSSVFVVVADERDAIQKKTFTKWVNKHLKKSQRDAPPRSPRLARLPSNPPAEAKPLVLRLDQQCLPPVHPPH